MRDSRQVETKILTKTMVLTAPPVRDHVSAIHPPVAGFSTPPFSAEPCPTQALTQAERKLGILKRGGLFGNDLKGCTIQRACTADDLAQAYRLVHSIYLSTGFITAQPSGMRLRIFETTPDTATFIAKVGGKVVGVLSVVQDSRDIGLPSDCVFKSELNGLRRHRRLCEVTNQVVAEEYRKSAVPTELMRCAIAISLSEGYEEAIAAVSPSHQGFYDLLGFRQIGSERSYSKTINDPVIAVSMDIDQYRGAENATTPVARFMRHFLREGNRFLQRMDDWAQEARRNFRRPELLMKLLSADGAFLGKCTSEQLAILRERWGDDVFAAVVGMAEQPDSAPSWRAQHSSSDSLFPGWTWLTPFRVFGGASPAPDFERFPSESARPA